MCGKVVGSCEGRVTAVPTSQRYPSPSSFNAESCWGFGSHFAVQATFQMAEHRHSCSLGKISTSLFSTYLVEFLPPTLAI